MGMLLLMMMMMSAAAAAVVVVASRGLVVVVVVVVVVQGGVAEELGAPAVVADTWDEALCPDPGLFCFPSRGCCCRLRRASRRGAAPVPWDCDVVSMALPLTCKYNRTENTHLEGRVHSQAITFKNLNHSSPFPEQLLDVPYCAMEDDALRPGLAL